VKNHVELFQYDQVLTKSTIENENSIFLKWKSNLEEIPDFGNPILKIQH
jgi:hypothetical protein